MPPEPQHYRPSLASLTDRQRQLLLYISSYIEQWGFPPTTREMALYMQVRSQTGVICHLLALKKKGWVSYGKTYRSVHILRPMPATSVNLVGSVLRVGAFQWELSEEQIHSLQGR